MPGAIQARRDRQLPVLYLPVTGKVGPMHGPPRILAFPCHCELAPATVNSGSARLTSCTANANRGDSVITQTYFEELLESDSPRIAARRVG